MEERIKRSLGVRVPIEVDLVVRRARDGRYEAQAALLGLVHMATHKRREVAISLLEETLARLLQGVVALALEEPREAGARAAG